MGPKIGRELAVKEEQWYARNLSCAGVYIYIIKITRAGLKPSAKSENRNVCAHARTKTTVRLYRSQATGGWNRNRKIVVHDFKQDFAAHDCSYRPRMTITPKKSMITATRALRKDEHVSSGFDAQLFSGPRKQGIDFFSSVPSNRFAVS